MQTVSNLPKKQDRETIRCPYCGKMIFDGDVVKSRVLKVLADSIRAKCQCKNWVELPFIYRI